MLACPLSWSQAPEGLRLVMVFPLPQPGGVRALALLERPDTGEAHWRCGAERTEAFWREDGAVPMRAFVWLVHHLRAAGELPCNLTSLTLTVGAWCSGDVPLGSWRAAWEPFFLTKGPHIGPDTVVQRVLEERIGEAELRERWSALSACERGGLFALCQHLTQEGKVDRRHTWRSEAAAAAVVAAQELLGWSARRRAASVPQVRLPTVTAAELGRMLGMSKMQVKRLLDGGQLPFEYDGATRVVTLRDAQAYQQKQCREPSQTAC